MIDIDSNVSTPRALMPRLSFPCPSFLASKSLDMCTECLGSETGFAIDDFPYQTSLTTTQRLENTTKKVKRRGGGGDRNFPPPLTSIASSGGVRMQTERHGGRLVINASTVSSSTRFQVDRHNGRLRLSLLVEDEEEKEEEEVERQNVDISPAEWSTASRCNGDISTMKRLQSLPFCVAIS